MIRREVDRRTALVAIGSVLATTSLGYLALENFLVPTEVKTQADASTTTYLPSSGISAFPPVAQNMFLAWDFQVWQIQQGGGIAAVSNSIKNIMETSGNDQLKSNLATFIRVTQRIQLLYPLLFGLNPNVSNWAARSTILGTIRRMNLDGLLSPIPAYIGDGLVAYDSSGVETNGSCQNLLGKIITVYQNQ